MSISFIPVVTEQGSPVWREVRIALGLSVGAALALGLSRFAYGLLLPPMRTDLGWTYVEAGALNTANGAGYIVGALVAASTASRWGMARIFLTGFAVSVLVLFLTAETRSFALLFVLRTLGGISTALTFILGAGLTAAICPAQEPRRRGTLVGLYMAGVGVGILLAGAAIPVLLETGEQRWPAGWAALGLMAAAGFPFAWRAARQVSEPAGGSMARLKAREFRQVAPTLAAYTLFGAGYVGYMTFVIALLRNQGSTSEQMTWFWLTLGLVATVTTLVWGRALGDFHKGRGPALVYTTSMLGTLPLLLSTDPVAMLLSAVLFGGSFLAGPAAMTIVVQRQLPPSSWTAALSLMTVGFASGQTVGPILAGAISDATGRIEEGFWVSAVLLGVAACVSLVQRPPAQETVSLPRDAR